MNVPMRLLVCFTVLLLHTFVYSQSVNKRYNSHMGNEGLVAFFYPAEVPVNDNAVVHDFSYDMTYNLTSDSLTLNFTVEGVAGVDELSVMFVSGEGRFELDKIKILYVEKAKDVYTYRFTSKALWQDVMSIFKGSLPLKVEMVVNGVNFTAQYGRKRWRKEVRVMSEIFELIEMQKKML